MTNFLITSLLLPMVLGNRLSHFRSSFTDPRYSLFISTSIPSLLRRNHRNEASVTVSPFSSQKKFSPSPQSSFKIDEKISKIFRKPVVTPHRNIQLKRNHQPQRTSQRFHIQKGQLITAYTVNTKYEDPSRPHHFRQSSFATPAKTSSHRVHFKLGDSETSYEVIHNPPNKNLFNPSPKIFKPSMSLQKNNVKGTFRPSTRRPDQRHQTITHVVNNPIYRVRIF